MAQINFNAREVQPDEGRVGPIPAAWYSMAATELKLEPTKDGQGSKISAKFQVLEGTYKGSTVFHNFNWQNSSEKAQLIGRAQFSALCHAVRVLDVNTTEQLLNIPFKARVKVTPAVMENGAEKYAAKNEISAFKDINDAAANAAPVAADAPKAPSIPAMPIPSLPQAAPMAPPQVPAPAMAPPPAWQAPAAAQPWAQAPAILARMQPQKIGAQPWAPAPAAVPNVPAQNPAPLVATPQPVANVSVPTPMIDQAAPAAAPSGDLPPWMQQQPQ